MKIKLKNSIIVSTLLSLFLSLPTFAMEQIEDDNIADNTAISAVATRFSYYKNKIRALEEEKTSLQTSKTELENNLKETDEIIEYVLEKATPTLFSYLSALSTGKSEEELRSLKDEASKEKIFPDLIVRVNKQVRKNTANSIVNLLAFHGDRIQVSDRLYSIDYAKATVPPTPEKTMNSLGETVTRSKDRRRSLTTETVTAEETEELTQDVRDINLNVEKAEEVPQNQNPNKEEEK